MKLTKVQMKALSQMSPAARVLAQKDFEAANERIAADNAARFAPIAEARRAARKRPFNVKPNATNTHVVIHVPGHAFPVSLTPTQWETFLAEQGKISPVVATLNRKEVKTA